MLPGGRAKSASRLQESGGRGVKGERTTRIASLKKGHIEKVFVPLLTQGTGVIRRRGSESVAGIYNSRGQGGNGRTEFLNKWTRRRDNTKVETLPPEREADRFNLKHPEPGLSMGRKMGRCEKGRKTRTALIQHIGIKVHTEISTSVCEQRGGKIMFSRRNRRSTIFLYTFEKDIFEQKRGK